MLIKLQQAYASVLPTLGVNVEWWADELKTISDDVINVKIYEPGKLVEPFEILDAVSSGIFWNHGNSKHQKTNTK